jgi:hypothetical protein
MSSAFDRIAEERIARAVAAGEFERLPGSGRPLDLGDDLLVPPEVRMGNRILKNAGCLPPELERLQAAKAPAAPGDAVQPPARRRVAALQMHLEKSGSFSRATWGQYAPAILRRFGAGK